MAIPIKINGKHLIEIMAPDIADALYDDISKVSKSIELQMYPSEVYLTSETYSKDTERTANYELDKVILVNRKAKPEFTWDCIKAEYVQKLFNFLGYKYDFKNTEGDIVPEDAPTFLITYIDLLGSRNATCYLGQTIEATLEENAGVLYWRNLRIAFPEL